MPGHIKISYKTLDHVEIKRIEAGEAERILGVRCALDGKEVAEFEYRLEDANVLAERISRAHIDRFDAEIVCRERWMATIK